MSPKSATNNGPAASPTPISRELRKIRKDCFDRVDNPYSWKQREWNTITIGTAHIYAVYISYLNLMGKAPWSIILVELIFGYISGLGITVGCHRYWTHKTFKANRPLQWLLMIMQSISYQYPILKWSRDHRIHHKYTDTNSDPHNSTRGFLFCHMGWLFVKKHPEHKEKLKSFDMTDLEMDPIVQFQSKWYHTIVFVFSVLLPVSATYYIWDLPLSYCIASNFRRFVVSLHVTWCVNSFAHFWGDKPYDKNITAVETPIVSILAVGEGWHNYHHTFPWDYQASEFGWKFNASTAFIDFFAWLGWAYDLKTVSHKMLKERQRRTGDGSQADTDATDKTPVGKKNGQSAITCSDLTERMKSVEEPVWGWDDKTLPDDFREITTILRPEGLKSM